MGRRPRLATLAVLLFVTLLIGGAIAAGGAFKDDFTVPGIESQRAQDLLEQRFPAQSGTSATLVFSAEHGTLAKRELGAALATIAHQPHVVSVDEPRLSRDGRTAFATVGYDQHRRGARRLGARAARGRDRRAEALRHRRRHVRRADRRRRHRRVPDRRADRARDRDRAADRRAAEPPRGGQRPRRRVRGDRARLRRADVGGRRDRGPRPRADARRHARASARASTTRCCSPRASRKSCGPAMRPSRPRAAPTRPRATRRSPRRASCSSRSPACWSPASRSWAAPASPPVWSCSPAP